MPGSAEGNPLLRYRWVGDLGVISRDEAGDIHQQGILSRLSCIWAYFHVFAYLSVSGACRKHSNLDSAKMKVSPYLVEHGCFHCQCAVRLFACRGIRSEERRVG